MSKLDFFPHEKVRVGREDESGRFFNATVMSVTDFGMEVRPTDKALRDWFGEIYWIGRVHFKNVEKVREQTEPTPVGEVLGEMYPDAEQPAKE